MKRHTVKQKSMESAIDQQQRSDMQAEKCRLIAAKAYELYEQRGRTDGHDLDDWFEAEARVNGRTNEAGA